MAQARDKKYIEDFKEFLESVYNSMKTVDLRYFEEQKKELERHRPLPKKARQSLEEKLEIDEVHNSTAIEGNTLSLGETALVLSKGLTVGGKSLKDHLEVKSYDRAYQYIKSIYSKVERITEDIILKIHKLIFVDFTEDLKAQLNHGVGIYRKEPVFSKGSSFVPPNYLKVPELMSFLINFLNSIKNNELRKAILAHLGLVTIHPFVDGNGRVARLLMNLVLFKAGWPIIIVRKERRGDYLNFLEDIQKNPQDKKFFNLMLEFLQGSFNLYKELY
ncbi:MAG: Fic family protein [Patescibacteria group bacterium]|nr:Fic family protein [Patescibacteria group bacterium]